MTHQPTWEMTIGEFVYNDLSSLKIAIKDKTTRIPQTYDPNCPDVIYDYTGNKCSFKEVLLEQTFHMSFPCSNPEKAKEQIKDSVKDGLVKIVFREQEKGTTNILLYVRDIGILDGKVHVMCVSPCIEKETCAADLLP